MRLCVFPDFRKSTHLDAEILASGYAITNKSMNKGMLDNYLEEISAALCNEMKIEDNDNDNIIEDGTNSDRKNDDKWEENVPASDEDFKSESNDVILNCKERMRSEKKICEHVDNGDCIAPPNQRDITMHSFSLVETNSARVKIKKKIEKHSKTKTHNVCSKGDSNSVLRKRKENKSLINDYKAEVWN